MNKKIIVPIVVGVLLLLGVVGFVLYNNQTISTVTLDINPSIELQINRNNKVKKVIALNEDAKDIVNKITNGKSFDEVINVITEEVISQGYADEGVTILISSTGKNVNKEVEEKVIKSFDDKKVHTEVIIVENISEEDKEIAKKYNISPAKASYINSISKENEELKIEDLIEKGVEELNETKETGNYCDPGYNLENDLCYKKVGEEAPVRGDVCPRGTVDDNGYCFEEVGLVDGENYVCNPEFNLDGDKCVRTMERDAEPNEYSCPSGSTESTRGKEGLSSSNDGDYNQVVCVDKSKGTHPVSPCELNDGTEWTKANGKCYWHKAPVIDSGCPGKVQINGMCWDDASNVLICAGARDGKRYNSRDEYCENSIKYSDPVITSYKCLDGYTLNGKKCTLNEVEEAQKEKVCPEDFVMRNDRCLRTSNPIDKQDGLYCTNSNAKLRGNSCYIYEIVPPKHN